MVDDPMHCVNCDKVVDRPVNFCDWDCHVELAKKMGGKVHCPNGLPIVSIDCNHDMWEHEHAKHPDYKFPVKVEYVGDLKGKGDIGAELAFYGRVLNDQEAREAMTETHALIYTDGSIALTLYECTYCIFSLRTGLSVTGHMWKKGEWKLDDAALAKIRELLVLMGLRGVK